MGVSGPYYIEDTKVRFHSETVSIIVRDRDQFNQVLETRFLARYVDYTLDPFSGELNFKTPVPSLDHNLNPVYIRVDYETESHDESYTTSGISGQYKLFDNLQLGGVYIQDDNPLDEMQLTGTNLLMKISENTLFAAEHAITDKPGIGKGSATRYELTYKNDQHQARIFYTDTDKLFDNRTSMYSQGRSESGIRADFRLTTSTLLKTELIQTKNTQDNSRLAGGQISLQQKLGDHLVVEVSGRHVETENTAQDNQNESDSISVKLSSQLPWHEKISLFAQVEQDTHDSDKKMAAIGGDYQLGVGTRLYGRHEFISTLGNTYGFTNTTERNATVFGIDSKYRQGASIFSEYRIRDSISGEDAEAAVGLQNSWIPSEGLKLNTRFEKIESLEGTTATEQTAASISLEYTGSARWKASSRVEWREGAQSSSTLFNLNMAYKLNRNMSFLGKWTDSNVDYSAQGEDRKNRLQIGIAWRDTDSDKLSVLGKLEWRGEDKPQPSGVKTERHIVIMSLHANYQPYRNIILNGRYAGKDVTELTSGRQSQHTAHLFSGRMTYDFRERWDMSVLASNYFDQGGKSRQYGLGVEIGYLLHANLWLSAGYNFFGYEDNDLINADYTQPGIYLRLRFKF
ncbi:MAG: hypothetical protein OEZ23_08915, partial [Gammaproteobacteria bacterium]|nr:hypothetical protein [Gammaproteobacteria bacterium]